MKGQQSSPVLPVLAVIGVTAVVVIMYIIMGGDDLPEKTAPSSPVSEVSIDADLPADTLRRIAQDSTATKAATKGNQEALETQREKIETLELLINRLTQQNQDLQETLTLSQESADSPTEPVDTERLKRDLESSLLEKLQGRLGAEIDRMRRLQSQPPRSQASSSSSSTGTLRIHGIQIPRDEHGRIDRTYLAAAQESPPKQTKDPATCTGETDPCSTPRYTIPPNAILLNSMTATTLIGRVPIAGDVSDPAPFKVIVGTKNLAASGHRIPGLSGMIMSGYAIGDSTLSCVRAEVNLASAVFEDGRTLTIRPGQKSGRLGWLSDDHGNPCIPGTYVTNMPRELGLHVLAGAAAGAADAYAASQTTTSVGTSGNVTSSVTGDSGRYVLGAAVSGASERLADHLEQRGIDRWDSVVVLAGTKVAVHIEQELRIDQATDQRRLHYASGTNLPGLID